MTESTHKPRVVVVGFDGAPPHLLRPWAEQGHLPAFARLLREGAWGTMASTPQCHSAPAWSSFATGVNPGRHGIFSFMNRVRGSYAARRIDARDRHGETFWETAGTQGRRCAVLNVPVTYPVSPLNGVQVADWLCPSLQAPGATYPAELAGELQQLCGEYRFHADVKRHALAGHHERALRNLREGLAQKAQVGRLLWEREPWDLFVLVFVETDAAQHYYLHTGDERHPLHVRAQAAGLEGALLEIYRQADAILGDLMASLDDQTTLVVMSDHGATANTQGRAYMRGLLRNLGLLAMKPPGPPAERLRRSLVRGRQWGFELLNAHLPKSVKVRLNALLPQARERVFADAFTHDVDWSQTRAYSYYWETDPYINLRGREPEGIVAPGSEYQQVRDELIEQLLAAREELTGQPAVADILKSDEVYHGEFADLAPDLIVRWAENLMINGLVSQVNGQAQVARAELRDDTLGAHHPDCLLALWGRGVRPGAVPAGVGIMDVAPTVLALLGCEVPAGLDGRVPTDLVDVTVREGQATVAAERSAQGVYSQQEEAEVEDRLRNLGYL